MLFWILWAIDAAVALVFVVFFFAGLGDGSVSSFNIVLWLAILAGLAAVLWGGVALFRAGHRRPAYLLTTALAVPALLAGAFMIVVLVGNPRWN